MVSLAALTPDIQLTVADREAALGRLRRFAHLMDSAVRVPGINFRVGLEPLIGLVPGIGDFAGALMASYVPLEAYRLGAPPTLLAQMAFNILIDALIGIIPLLGDLFDAIWKPNLRNVHLLEDYLERY